MELIKWTFIFLINCIMNYSLYLIHHNLYPMSRKFTMEQYADAKLFTIRPPVNFSPMDKYHCIQIFLSFHQ